MLEKGPRYRSNVLKLIASAIRSTPRAVAARLMHESDPDSPPFVLMRALQGEVRGAGMRVLVRLDVC